jgi:hypothetical protein
MNERIRELAEQAGYTKDMFGVGHWDMPECKKFAQLIVRECANIVTDAVDHREPASTYADKIRQHFRVEE